MDELVEWLRAQLDEDERIAREASGWLKPAAYWSLDEWSGREEPHSLIAQGSPRLPVVGGHFTADPVPTVQAEHIVRHDPARVLREIDAKRCLLNDCTAEARVMAKGHRTGWAEGAQAVREHLIKTWAAIYDQRPGYREEWRP